MYVKCNVKSKHLKLILNIKNLVNYFINCFYKSRLKHNTVFFELNNFKIIKLS